LKASALTRQEQIAISPEFFYRIKKRMPASGSDGMALIEATAERLEMKITPRMSRISASATIY